MDTPAISLDAEPARKHCSLDALSIISVKRMQSNHTRNCCEKSGIYSCDKISSCSSLFVNEYCYTLVNVSTHEKHGM